MSVDTGNFDESIAKILNGGGVGILRTDTLYGLMARADNQAAVERVYAIKQRTATKSTIVLIASTEQLFDSYERATMSRLEQFWPGENSIILPSQQAPAWLTRGNQSVAYRQPASIELRQLIERTGPLIAPSANPEGEPPASNILQAKAYFGTLVDFYVDSGDVGDTTPSRLYRLNQSGIERLR